MIEIFKLKEGDVFIHKNIVYEIIRKDKWTSCCRYVNDKYKLGGWCKSICIVILVII